MKSHPSEHPIVHLISQVRTAISQRNRLHHVTYLYIHILARLRRRLAGHLGDWARRLARVSANAAK